MEKRIDPTKLTDDELIKRWKAWLEHTKKEAYEFYSFRFKAENVSKMFTENKALHTEGGSSMLGSDSWRCTGNTWLSSEYQTRTSTRSLAQHANIPEPLQMKTPSPATA